MHKTLLLVFIHGFKGDDNTFRTFPEHLRALISHALPKVTVKAVVYPKYETVGDLKECVAKFREWLQNKVIDMEASANTPSPTIDPSVYTVLIGHSMGGIVAADALISINSETPISSTGVKEPKPSSTTKAGTTSTSTPNVPKGNGDTQKNTKTASRPPSPNQSFMFPFIQGILAFDTPYLGISPGVIAHGAESHYQSASSAYGAATEIAALLGFGTGNAGGSGTNTPSAKSGRSTSAPAKKPAGKAGSLPAGPEAAKEMLSASADAAGAGAGWASWGKYALFAGAAGAVAAGGAAAYMKKDAITEGWIWIGSHLEFVGCLMRGEELKQRVTTVLKLNKERQVGFADLYTLLGGKSAEKPGTTVAGGFVEIGGVEAGKRTFCTLPRRQDWQGFFEPAVNEKMTDEAMAHMNMFIPRDNPGYYTLGERAKQLVVDWVDTEWYDSSEPLPDKNKNSLGEN